jgi:ketopantoate reductase
MRILMVGAGAVGTVLTRHLENKTNELTYYVRAGRKAKLARTKILDARSEGIFVRERPAAVEPGDKLPIVDTAILAVRADQLDEALDLVARLIGDVRIVTASAGLDDLERIRHRFPHRPAVQILPLFMAYPDGDAIRFWNPPLARTLITDEHDEAARPLAEELAAALTAGGLPARALRSFGGAREAVFALGMPLLAGFELAGWDLGALAGDGELRSLASRGMREGVSSLVKNPLARRLVALAPAPLFAAALRAAPAMLPRGAKEMWRVHGPKIAGQTRQLLDLLIARAAAAAAPVDGLRELRRRLDAPTV